MRRITVSEIEKVVSKLLTPIVKKLQDLEDEIRGVVAFYLHKQYPAEVHALLAEKCKFLNWQSYITVYYLGQHKGVSFSNPGVVAKSGQINIEDRAAAELIQKCVNEIIDLKKEYSIMEADITSTLKSLRTFEKIRKEFPEAAAFLPEDGERHLPALNISDIQSRLKNLV